MTIYEVYRLNIPMFVPSQKLLLKWHTDYNFVWERVYGHVERQPIPADRGPKGVAPLRSIPYVVRGRDQRDVTDDDNDAGELARRRAESRGGALREEDDLERMPDPNSDDPDAFAYWLQFHDYYVWPHVQYFDSWEQLLLLLDTVDLQAVSRKMARHNVQLRQDLLDRWREALARAFGDDVPGSRVVPQDFDEAMRTLYPSLGDQIFPDDDQDIEECAPGYTPVWVRWLTRTAIVAVLLLCVWFLRRRRRPCSPPGSPGSGDKRNACARTLVQRLCCCCRDGRRRRDSRDGRDDHDRESLLPFSDRKRSW